jgi:hypothetical protein
MSSLSEYENLKKTIRALKWVARNINDRFYDATNKVEYWPLDDKHFRNLETYLNTLKKYPSVAKLEEFHLLSEAVKATRYPKNLWQRLTGEHKKRASKVIIDNVNPVIIEARKISENIKPAKYPNKKELIIQAIRKIKEYEEELDKDLKRLREQDIEKLFDSGWEKLWIGTFNPDRVKIIEGINELVSIEPYLGCEDEFAGALNSLEIILNPDIRSKENVEFLVESHKYIGSAIGKVKEEYNITEEDIERKSRLEQPKELAALMQKTPIKTKEVSDIYEHYCELLDNVKNKSPLPTFQRTLSLLKSILSSSEFRELTSTADDLLQLLPRYQIEVPSYLSNEEREIKEGEHEKQKEEFIRLADKFTNQIGTELKIYINQRIRMKDLGQLLN